MGESFHDQAQAGISAGLGSQDRPVKVGQANSERRAALYRLLDDRTAWSTEDLIQGQVFKHMGWSGPSGVLYALYRIGDDDFVVEEDGSFQGAGQRFLLLPAWASHPAMIRETVHTLVDWGLDAWVTSSIIGK